MPWRSGSRHLPAPSLWALSSVSVSLTPSPSSKAKNRFPTPPNRNYFGSASLHLEPAAATLVVGASLRMTGRTNSEAYMALKTLQFTTSKLARPRGNSFGALPPSDQPKLPPRRIDARTAAKKHRKNSSRSLKCRANLHGCVGEVVRTPTDQTTELPIVMHPSVVFPGATLRLQAFEFKHRIMMHTLLQQGWFRFGMVYSGGKDGGMADAGCVVHVLECEGLIDDRFFLTCVGGDRFRVVDVVRTKPYVVARVQVLSDRPAASEPRGDDLGSLMRRVERHLKDVAVLLDRLDRKPWGDRQAEQLRRLHSAASFSFLVARLFIDDRSEQQALLRMDDTAQRLAREGMYLESRSKYLAAVAAIKDAFKHLSCNEK